MFKIGLTFIVLLLFLVSCKKETSVINDFKLEQNINKYFFVGYAYKSKSKVDDRLTRFDFSEFNQILLGGDMCSATTENKDNIEHLDSIFNLGSQNTHWALGNHDTRNGNINWITDKTLRPTYYATYFNNITLLVLNTNFTPWGTYDPILVNSQFDLISQVCDSINVSTHLIVLTHNALWEGIDNISNLGNYANTDLSNLLFSINPDFKYLNGIYPKLVDVQRKGINVIHIAGDFGQKVSRYSHLSSDSIQFIGSGITSNIPYNEQFPSTGLPDYYLVLRHDLNTQEITWEFKELL